MFSDIVQRFETSLNALYQERDARKARGERVIDLVSGNVTRAGFVFPPTILKRAMAAGVERARIYSPDPMGQRVAREEIETYYHTERLDVPADQIVLTSGTSLSYHYLFKLLANPGDEILCAKPSYPLLDSIAELSGVKLTAYRLKHRARWEIDFDSLRAGLTPRTRAIVLISPHNPTGAVAMEAEIEQLCAIAAQHHLPIISDEVFSAFLFHQKSLPRPAGKKAPLVFTLNGLSKMFALPGMKIGWIAVTGDAGPVKTALHALDLISDTFLPVNETVQFALPVLFRKGKSFLSAYQRGVRRRAETVMTYLADTPGVSVSRAEGGFYLTIQTPGMDGERIALDLLQREGLLLHPGYFYDLDEDSLVLSFVVEPKLLNTCLKKLRQYFKQKHLPK